MVGLSGADGRVKFVAPATIHRMGPEWEAGASAARAVGGGGSPAKLNMKCRSRAGGLGQPAQSHAMNSKTAAPARHTIVRT